VYAWLENAFRELHAYAMHSVVPGDYIGMSFNSENFLRGSTGISFRPARDLTHEDIWNLVSALAQSAGGLDIAREFDIRVFKITPPGSRT